MNQAGGDDAMARRNVGHLICDDCGKVETFATKSSSVRSISSKSAPGIPLPATTSCFASRGEADFADQLLSAMRKQFGGHAEIAAAAG